MVEPVNKPNPAPDPTAPPTAPPTPLEKSKHVTATTFSKQPKRQRSSKLIVCMDKLAHCVITIGGLGTIMAVLTVFFFLLYVVMPLFMPATAAVGKPLHVDAQVHPAFMGLDENKRLLWELSKQGDLRVIDVASGAVIEEHALYGDQVPSALMVSVEQDHIVAGFANGEVRLGSIEFKNTFLDADTVEPAFRDMHEGERRRRNLGVVYKTPSRQWRQTELQVTIDKPLKLAADKEIKFIDYTMTTSGPVIITCDVEQHMQVHHIAEHTNFMTMKTERSLSSRDIPTSIVPQLGPPLDMILIGSGQYVLLLWKDGYSERYNLLDEQPYLAEKTHMSRNANAGEITSVGRFLGRNTVLLGYASGEMSAWFLAGQGAQAQTQDKKSWVEGHVFPGSGAAVVAVASSSRQRLAAVSYADGTCKLIHVTSERIIYDGPSVAHPLAVAVAPKDDGIIVNGQEQTRLIGIDAEHPDVTLASLFLPVWYEGYAGPKTDWQSSSASDDAEAKLGLWPLIFGTFKATFYSLLFGVPVALAAAMYSSEFMKPELKKVVKPTIEMMASLPSVVLGFIGGIIISAWMKAYVVDVLAAFFVIPLCVSAAAYLTQLLPRPWFLRLSRQRLYIIAIPCFALGWLLSRTVARVAEILLFNGSFIHWLDGGGSSFGGVWYLCLPVAMITVIFVMSRWGKPYLIESLRSRSLLFCASIDLIKFVCSIIVTIALAAGFAWLLMLVGLDFRGPRNVFDTYETRNALVVGFMMAFAIIPIIYTIADDALSTVPGHLRAASLGCGATQWQTAMRVVVPTAMSGLFSAVMVGLGRAIGETMIVLMAAGNTPIKDFNLFSGFKTLSANIASELPESVANSTHYRTLFLSALVLFIMTFILNTLAEYIRSRFRKQAVSL